MPHNLSHYTGEKQQDWDSKETWGVFIFNEYTSSRKAIKTVPQDVSIPYHVLHYKKRILFGTYKSWPKKKKIQSISGHPLLQCDEGSQTCLETGDLGPQLPGTSVIREPHWPSRHSSSFNLSGKTAAPGKVPSCGFRLLSAPTVQGLGLKENPEEAISTAHDKLPGVSPLNCNDFQQLTKSNETKQALACLGQEIISRFVHRICVHPKFLGHSAHRGGLRSCTTGHTPRGGPPPTTLLH